MPIHSYHVLKMALCEVNLPSLTRHGSRRSLPPIIPKQRSSKTALSDTLFQFRLLFSVLKQVGEFAPLAPLKGIGGLGCVIIEILERVRDLKDSCGQLAEKAAHMVLAIITEVSKAGTSESMGVRIDSFAMVLSDIADTMAELATYGRYRRCIKQKSMQDALVVSSDRLDKCYKIFNITTLIDIHRLTERMAADLATTRDAQLAMKDRQDQQDELVQRLTRLAEGSSPSNIDGIRVVSQRELTLHLSIRQRTGEPCFYIAEHTEGNSKGAVIVRMYTSNHPTGAFLQDLQRLRKIWHPNAPQLTGRSPEAFPTPYLVVTDYASSDVRDFVLDRLDVPVEGFLRALSIVQGIAAGLLYLYREVQLGKADLQSCTQLPSFRLTHSGVVVVGHNVLACEPWTEGLMGVDADLDAWLRSRVWIISKQIICGDKGGIRQDDWQSIQASPLHLRPLLTYTSFPCPSFPLMSERLTELAGLLRVPTKGDSLTYSAIRSAMLKTPHFGLDYFYRPPNPLNAVRGDVGYIKEDRFFRLHNVSGDLVYRQASYVGHTKSSGKYVSEDIGNGIVRYTFEEPLHMELSRYRDPKQLKDSRSFWSYFMKEAPHILRNYGVGHDITVSDLVLVTGVWVDRRFASWELKIKKDKPSGPPHEVQFVEYRDALPDEPWGKWVYGATEHDVEAVVGRHPQHIEFIQLDREEYDN